MLIFVIKKNRCTDVPHSVVLLLLLFTRLAQKYISLIKWKKHWLLTLTLRGVTLNFNICPTFFFTWSSQVIFGQAKIACSLKENKIKKTERGMGAKNLPASVFFNFKNKLSTNSFFLNCKNKNSGRPRLFSALPP